MGTSSSRCLSLSHPINITSSATSTTASSSSSCSCYISIPMVHSNSSSQPIFFRPHKSIPTSTTHRHHLKNKLTKTMNHHHPSLPSSSPSPLPLKCGRQVEIGETRDGITAKTHTLNPDLLHQMVYDALVWSSLHGLLVGDKSIQNSGSVPGVGIVHAPFSLLPVPFPESHWTQACELTPIFNELVDRVSSDGQFLQEALSSTKKADAFTSRLLDIHSKMLEMNKKEEIVLGLHRSDYMVDDRTKNLLQIELNTISSSFAGLSCVVSELHRVLLNQYGKFIGLDSTRVPQNAAVSQYAEALATAWKEYNHPRAVVLIVVQTEERNMYDQHWLSMLLRERHDVTTIRRTLAQIDAEGQLLPDGTLRVGGYAVAVVYFRAGYAPNDYPSESEWRARVLMEQSSAVKCPSISYHLAGTKKIQQELAKPNVLERFLEKKGDIAKLRKCFAGLWSLDDPNVIKDAIERPELFVLKPQREGGGNNIYGSDVRETLLKLQKESSEELSAYILMQRIFPTASSALLIREGTCHQEDAISELGIYGTYLRNKDKLIMNESCGYLMRTKVSSSNEGGVAAGFAVLDSIYLTD